MEIYTMSEIRVVDASFDPLTRTEAECLKAGGTSLYVQGLWTSTVAPVSRVNSMRNAINAGLPVAAYASLNHHNSGVWHIRRARDKVPQDIWNKLLFVAVDIELRGITIQQITDAVNEVERLGKRAIIYTNRNSWLNYVIPSNDGTLAKRGILLWNALWDLNPDIDFPRLPFGRWSPAQVIGEQWSGGTMVCKQFVDRNTFIKELLFQKEEEHMASEEFEKLNRKINNVAGITKIVITDLDKRIIQLVNSTTEHKDTIAAHFTTHNTSGGVLEREALVILDKVVKLIAEGNNIRTEFTTQLSDLRKIFKDDLNE